MRLLADLAVTDGQVIALAAFLCSTIGALFLIREKERSAWFQRVESATAAIEALTATVDGLTRAMEEKNRVVAALSQEVQTLRAEVAELRVVIARRAP